MESNHFLCDVFFCTLSLSITVEDKVVDQTDVDSDFFVLIFMYIRGLQSS